MTDIMWYNRQMTLDFVLIAKCVQLQFVQQYVRQGQIGRTASEGKHLYCIITLLSVLQNPFIKQDTEFGWNLHISGSPY